MLIFLAESDQNLRLGMQMLLHQEAGMHVIGMAIQANGLLVQVEASQAEVLILDWHLPGASMPELLSDICRLESPPKIVVLSVSPEAKGPALSAGADAFIGKNAPPDELLEVVRSMKKTVNSMG
jgi:DNA-binding NarL/FixJ family response regulator